MRTYLAVGLFFATALLMPAPPALSAPQHKQTSSKQAPSKKTAAPKTADVPLTTAILGVWTADLPGKNGTARAHLTTTFNKDGTATQIIESPGHKVRQWIKYQIDNGWITQSLVRAEDNGKLFMPTNPGTHKLRLHILGDLLSIAVSEGGPNQLVLHRVKNSK